MCIRDRTYLNVVQCIPFKRIAELISDLSGQNISEGTVQNILKENSGKADLSLIHIFLLSDSVLSSWIESSFRTSDEESHKVTFIYYFTARFSPSL